MPAPTMPWLVASSQPAGCYIGAAPVLPEMRQPSPQVQVQPLLGKPDIVYNSMVLEILERSVVRPAST
eukprot:683667-Lingulodinium_polyedra.AAC.1